MRDGIYLAETQAERNAVFALRYAIYVEEMGRLGDIADHEKQHLVEAADAHGRLYLAVVDGEPVGTMRLSWGGDPGAVSAQMRALYETDIFAGVIDDAQLLIGERLMVQTSQRGTDLAMRMLAELGRFMVTKGAEVLFLECEPHLINLYLRLGMRPYTRTKNYPGIGLVVPMVLLGHDLAHLKRTGSLYWAIFQAAPPSDAERVAAQVKKLDNVSAMVSRESTPRAHFMAEVLAGLAEKKTATPAIFDALSEAQIEMLVARSHIFEVQAGDHLVLDGGAARSLFVVLGGVVEIYKDGVLLGVQMPGDVFGEFAFLLGLPRTADVIAGSDVRVLCLSEANLLKLQAKEPALSSQFMLNLSRCICQKLLELRQTFLTSL
ncbi:MAG: cyclic nucleotide-binding domain-containing protein [Myxococcales bacterium]|nr:cyclic nucleotide-binding domain-containing protein [Myxococcales bacterium]